MIRLLIALGLVSGFAWLVAFQPHLLAAGLCLILAAVCVRSWYRHELPRVPDPHEDWGP